MPEVFRLNLGIGMHVQEIAPPSDCCHSLVSLESFTLMCFLKVRHEVKELHQPFCDRCGEEISRLVVSCLPCVPPHANTHVDPAPPNPPVECETQRRSKASNGKFSALLKHYLNIQCNRLYLEGALNAAEALNQLKVALYSVVH